MDRKTYTDLDRDWQSLAMPVVLILTGLLLMMGEGLGLLSEVRVENLWPMAVLLVGLSELSRDLAESQKESSRSGRR
jgi:hypothetical protein